ncbi:MAG: hypothetical protein ACLFST_05930 [Spirochaetia bacterium]
MAKIDEIKKNLLQLTYSELESLTKELKSIKKEVLIKEKEEQSKVWIDKARIGLWVKYTKTTGTSIGKIIVIKEEGVQVEADGKKRKQFVNWYQIDGIYNTPAEAKKN